MLPRLASLFVLLVPAVIALPALALPTDRDQPLQVAADTASFNEKTGIATYRGAVVIRQGTLEVRADELVLTVDKAGNVTTTVALGKPARYQQQTDPRKGLVSAEASRIDYDLKTETITLSGQARLKQDGASFQGASIVYAIARQQVEAKGDASNRVQLVLPPQPRAPRKESR
jgi:lipopolysaccharide export system protein LptA